MALPLANGAALGVAIRVPSEGAGLREAMNVLPSTPPPPPPAAAPPPPPSAAAPCPPPDGWTMELSRWESGRPPLHAAKRRRSPGRTRSPPRRRARVVDKAFFHRRGAHSPATTDQAPRARLGAHVGTPSPPHASSQMKRRHGREMETLRERHEDRLRQQRSPALSGERQRSQQRSPRSPAAAAKAADAILEFARRAAVADALKEEQDPPTDANFEQATDANEGFFENA